MSYHTATGIDLPVSSDNHQNQMKNEKSVSPALLSFLGLKRFAECTGTFSL